MTDPPLFPSNRQESFVPHILTGDWDRPQLGCTYRRGYLSELTFVSLWPRI